MLSAFCQWRDQTRHELTEVGTEVDVDGVLASPEPGLPDVRVRGRIDRLERDGAGRLVVVDVKTSKNPASKDDAQRHAQLAIYQLAVAGGLLRRRATPRRRPPCLPRQARRRRTRPGRADPGCPAGLAAGAAPGSGGNDRPRVPGPGQRQLRALPGAVQLPGSGATIVIARYSPAELADALGLPAPTDEQAAVIAAPPGPLVVIAGAGAGKTETMAARVVWLVGQRVRRPGSGAGADVHA